VLLAVIENDITDLRKDLAGAPMRPKDQVLTGVQTWLRAFGRSSALVNLAEQVKTGMQFSAAGVDIRRGEGDRAAPTKAPPAEATLMRRYGELFSGTAALLKDQGINLAVTYIPAAETVEGALKPSVEPAVRALAAETNTPYLDVTPILQRQPDPAERL